MAYQTTITITAFALAFATTFIGNVLLAIMIIKLKRQEERKKADRRRHFDVLFTALAVGDTLGSCLNYPMLLHSYRLPVQETKSSDLFCAILGSSSVVYFSYIAILTMAMTFHNIAGNTWPLRYFVYQRQKRSKIPLLCVGVSLFVAVVSLTISASGFPLFKLTPTRYYFDVITCAPDSSYNSLSKYYYFLVGHLCFWTHFFCFILSLWNSIKRKSNQIAKFGRVTGKIGWLGLPAREWFHMAFKLMYLIFWSPLLVVMTIITCTHYSIPVDIIVTVCYVVFLPGLLGPFVHYVTHDYLRDVFNATIREAVSRRVQETKRENAEIVIQNLNSKE